MEFEKGKKVYVLQHRREIDEEEDVKFIGVYSSKIEADCAIERCLKLQGFCNYPLGFSVDEYEIDVDNWIDGFVTVND